jgi:amino acid transporter
MSVSIPAAATPAAAAPSVHLRHNSLSLTECLGQSIANVAPTLTPALNISVVAGLAGSGSWVSYLIATVGLLFVAACISALAQRHPQAGSYFVYIGRNFGPYTGALAGWSMIAAYLVTAIAVVLGVVLFLANMLDAFGMAAVTPPMWLTCIVFMGLVWFAGYRDIRLSSRVGLVLEAISISVIIVITALVVGKQGKLIDHTQLDVGTLHPGAIMSAMAFAVFSFVGFESAATLAKETRDPARTVPRAVVISTALVGVFFTIMAYFMIMAVKSDPSVIGNSSAPFADMTKKAGLGWAAGIVYFAALISAFACALASVNAAARMVYSMGRYRFFTGHMGRVHATHQTPHVAVTLSCGFTLLATLLLLAKFAALDAFGYTGTFATLGFLLVYLLTCVVAPVDLRRSGGLKQRHVVVAVIGTVLMGFVIFGSLYPVPPYPYNLIPYIFVAYMLVGAIWFGVLKLRRPGALDSLEHDMEEATLP